jgi:hypothetical protein
MRVIAPVVLSALTKCVRLRPIFAQDPLKQQYERCSNTTTREADKVGIFEARDPDKGVWPLSMQQRGILQEVSRSINSEWIRKVLLPAIDPSDKRVEPSLRLLDWFVTNYSKSRGVALNGISIHSDYVDTRRAYQCRHFDPFRRNLKLSFQFDDETHHTTVAQINFMLWAHTTGVLDYVRANKEDIDNDMANVCRKRREQRKADDGTSAKRVALSSDRHLPCRVMRCKRLLDLQGVCVKG